MNVSHTLPRGGSGSSASSTIASDRMSLVGGYPGSNGSSYYPAGYPVHYEDHGRYKNVVKELEDAKL